ncbi:MAG: cytidylate kinase family protein, partial [Bifidobacteriaceae bacterium]|nr:cytidylate kinase family protein [Bifidobacteriaceae bacterium]
MTGDRPAVRHITISGDLGSGKSSAAQALAERLGFETLSTGALQRRMAASHGLSTLDVNHLAEKDLSIDDKIDGTTVRVAREATAPIVFDSRMAWHFVPGALKVRLVVDPFQAAQRVYGREGQAAESYASLTESLHGIVERARSESRRFLGRYGVDVAALHNFDLVVDTSALPVEGVVDRVARTYERLVGPEWSSSAADAGPCPELWLSPSSVVPLFAAADAGGAPSGEASDAGPVVVVYDRPFFFGIGGRAALCAALASGEPVVRARLAAETEATSA